MSLYRTVVVDPPWPQVGGGTLRGREGWHDAHGASQPLKYPTMTVAQIKQLPIRQLMDPAGSHVYLWATNGFLPQAFDVLTAWGYTYSTTLVWAKTPMGGGLGGSYGISTEFCLFGHRGRALSERRPRVRGTWWNWKRPYDSRGKPQSSAKPPKFHGIVEAASPEPYLELFARREYPGWDVWGDQAPGSIIVPALSGIGAAS